MSDKIRYDEFRQDISALLANDQSWSFEDAHEMVQEQLICLLPGSPLKMKIKS